MQQREANLTALAAIGPRKKRPLDSSNAGSGLEVLRFLAMTCVVVVYLHIKLFSSLPVGKNENTFDKMTGYPL